MSNQLPPDNPYQSPLQTPTGKEPSPFRKPEEGDATGGVIPYKNVPALLAYYMGIFSLIPCIGGVIGIAAVVLGILGLRTYYANKAVHGVVHAWIGIVLGGGAVLLYGGLMLFGIIGAFVSR